MVHFLNNKRIRVSKKKNKECLFATNEKKYNNIDLPTRKTGSAALIWLMLPLEDLMVFSRKFKFMGYCRRYYFSSRGWWNGE